MLCERIEDHICLTFTLEEWFKRSEHERDWLRRHAMQFGYLPRVTVRFYLETWPRVAHFFPELGPRKHSVLLPK